MIASGTYFVRKAGLQCLAAAQGVSWKLERKLIALTKGKFMSYLANYFGKVVYVFAGC